MAVPSYTTDLTTYTDCTSVTGFAEATNMTGTDGSGVVDSDLAIHGTQCVSESQRKSGLGSLVYTGTAPTLPTTGGFFIWHKFFAPNSLDTKANGGIRGLVGSSSANYRGWYLTGSNTYPYGGWKNYVVDPRQTGLATQTQGSPTTTYATVGIGVNQINGISKGNAFTIDIIRWGRGEARFTGGESANYATFAGFAAVNDNATTGRWGLIQAIDGGYLWKGLMSLGLTATAVDFRDANKVISIDNTEFVASAFNRIEVHNASSNVEWTAINISALGTQSRGQFEMINNATVSKNSCTFTDMDTFIYQSNATITDCTYRRCNQVTLGGASASGTLFTNATSASSISAATLNNITNCSFISDGSNHAVTLTSIGAGSMSWSGNKLTGYATGTAASPVTPTSTGNEAIYVNVGSGTLTINVSGGATVPSIRSAGATVNVVASTNVNITNLKDNTEIRVMAAGTDTELTGTDAATTGTTDNRSYSFSLSAGTSVDIFMVSKLYENIEVYAYTIPSSDAELPQQQRFDRVYLNP